MNHCCGLYIHIPFCQSKCPYCDFYSKACTPAESSLYTQKLCEIISLYAELYPNKIFDTLYIGGGTPSIIGTDNLVKIVTAAKQHFHTVSDMEITIEMNPCSAVKMDFDQLSAVNVNRISLGVQSANENELQLLGRIHRNADVIRTAEKIQKSKIENLSLDVMVGIAEQNETSLKNSLDFCIQNGAKHISAYLLKIEPNTPYQKLASRLNLPDDDKQADLYEFMVNYLTNKGYCQYEISNFAFSGFESRHNLKYWNCEEYLGLGASAHSHIALSGHKVRIQCYPYTLTLYPILDGKALKRTLTLGPFLLGGNTYITCLTHQVFSLFIGHFLKDVWQRLKNTVVTN